MKAEQRKNFNLEMLHKSGYHKMTYTMVRDLCATFKRDFAKVAIIKSKEAQDMIMEAKAKGREMHENIQDQIWAIEDVQGDMHVMDKNFEKAMMRKAKVLDAEAKKKLGLAAGPKFNMPNIKDVKSLYKDYCWACENGK